VGLIWSFKVPSIGLADKLVREVTQTVSGQLEYPTGFKYTSGSLDVRVSGASQVPGKPLGFDEGVSRNSFKLRQSFPTGRFVEVRYIKDDVQ
jgi:hypothetical protein